MNQILLKSTFIETSAHAEKTMTGQKYMCSIWDVLTPKIVYLKFKLNRAPRILPNVRVVTTTLESSIGQDRLSQLLFSRNNINTNYLISLNFCSLIRSWA